MKQDLRDQIISIMDDVDDLTIATVREDGYPQATSVSYVNDGLTIYFGTDANGQKARNIARCNKVSVTINRPYANWSEIEGLSLAAIATLIEDETEQRKAGELLMAKFPQIAQYVPPDMDPADMAFFRLDPQYVSVLDYRKGFGHCELVRVDAEDLRS